MSKPDSRQIRHYFVSGLVQGVYYRASAMHAGQELGLSGWVRNLPDGRVEAIASGHNEALQRFRLWLDHGPTAARVESVDETTVQHDDTPIGLPFPFAIRR